MVDDFPRYILIDLHQRNSRDQIEDLNWQTNSQIGVNRSTTFWPRGMYFMATSSFVSLFLIKRATPKFPAPKSFNSSYFSIFELIEKLNSKSEAETAELKVTIEAWRI